MQIIILQPLAHRNMQCIAHKYANNGLLNSIVQELPDAKWSRTHQCWYVPKTEEHYTALKSQLAGKAIIKVLAMPLAGQQTTHNEKRHAQLPIVLRLPTDNQPKKQVGAANAHVLRNMEQHLQLKAYSPSTIRTYLNEMAQLLTVLKSKPADELTESRIKDYLQYCYVTLKLTENTLHSRMNALKFYYDQVLKKEKFFWEIPRPKKQLQLPSFFNQDEIAAILKGTANLKHKTMLMLAYCAGLRVSEVVAIKVYHIDSKRMQITIRQAKGKR